MDRATGKDNAVGFDYPNNVAPQNYNNIHHTSAHVPKPTNTAAKVTSAHEVLRAVLEGK